MPIPFEGPATAGIMILGDAPSDLDERSGRPFMGSAGMTLDQLLREAGTSRAECLIGTIARDKAPGGKLSFFFEDNHCTKPKPYFQEYVAQTKADIERYRPNIIIALGAVAMYYLTGNQGINSFRGYITDCSLVPGTKVLVTHHPQTVNHDWKLAWQTVMDLRKAINNSYCPEISKDIRELIINPTPQHFIDYCDYLIHKHTGPIALDIETRPGSHIDIIGLADSANRAMSINFLDGNIARFQPETEVMLWDKLSEVCNEKEIIMQNGTYDSGVLWYNNHIRLPKYNRDILFAAHACWPECPRSLGFLASICLNVPPWKHTSQETPELYNAADAANTYGIWEVLEVEMAKQGVRQTHDFEIRQTAVATYLQLRGIDIDREKQKEIKETSAKRLNELEDELYIDLGKRVNFQSPKQLQSLLYIDMGLPVQYKKRKSINDPQTPTANAEALTKLNRMVENPVLGKILEVKKLQKLLTFVDCTVSPEGTVHTCYNITGATMSHEKKGVVTDDDDSYKSFGRWSSSASIIKPYGSGNLQNIPEAARYMYYAGDGKVFVQADYKQAEAVVVAYLIGDEKLKTLFKASFGLSDEECDERNLDVHKITAAGMSGIKVEFVNTEKGLCVLFSEEVTPQLRKVGKTIRHATNYSAGPGVLATKLGIPMSAGKKLLTGYANLTPQLGIWQKRIQNELQQTRILTNLLGRKHRFLERWGDDLFRSAYSFKPQSTVGDLLNKSLVLLHDDYGVQLWDNPVQPPSDKVDIALQLHDAIYIRVDEDKVDFGKKILKECMIERTQPLICGSEEFYIDIDFKVAKYWGELH